MGCTLLGDGVRGVIVEVERYQQDDPASHSFRGPDAARRGDVRAARPGSTSTAATACTGALNVVCEPEGHGAAVLLRALAPTGGLDVMRARRGARRRPAALLGPGAAQPGARHRPAPRRTPRPSTGGPRGRARPRAGAVEVVSRPADRHLRGRRPALALRPGRVAAPLAPFPAARERRAPQRLAARAVDVPAARGAGGASSPWAGRCGSSSASTRPRRTSTSGHAVVLGKLREFQDAGHTRGADHRRLDGAGRRSLRAAPRPGRCSRRGADRGQRRDLPRAGLPHPRPRSAPRSGPTASGSPGWASSRCSASPRAATVNQLLRRNDFAERMGARPAGLGARAALPADAGLRLGHGRGGRRAGRHRPALQPDARAATSRPAYGQPPQVVHDDADPPGHRRRRRSMSKSLRQPHRRRRAPEEQFGKHHEHPRRRAGRVLPAARSPAEPPPVRPPGRRRSAAWAPGGRSLPRPGRRRAGRGRTSTASYAITRPRTTSPRSRSRPAAVHLPALLVDALGVASRSEARRLIAGAASASTGSRSPTWTAIAAALDGKVLRAGKRRFARLVRA